MILDPEFLSRIQFAFTIAFHIMFPALSIGLSMYLTWLEWRWVKTKDAIYKQQHDFWLKIFALGFGIGVVTGIVMAYQFGTNWANLVRIAGNIIGPLMGYEVLTAFFLEAGFLGILLFGRSRVSEKMYLFSNFIVAFGTSLSAFWILAVNSWMQTPAGHKIIDGIFYPDSWFHIVFNPSFIYHFTHMLFAAFLSATFFVMGISAWYILKNKNLDFAKKSFSYTMIAALVAVPLQIFIGDLHGIKTLEHQPQKIAAMEGLWETTKGAPTTLIGWPDEEAEETKYAIDIPHGSSLILTHSFNGEVPGLKSFPKEERPPVAPVFFSFRVMVGIGFLMLLAALWGGYLMYRKRLFDNKPLLYLSVLLTPMGLVATIAGWFVTEIGRQPYTVYKLLKTSHSVSNVSGFDVALSLTIFIIVYMFILAAFLVFLFRLIAKGPKDTTPIDSAFGHKDSDIGFIATIKPQ